MRSINVTEFCNHSNINADMFRDTIEAMGLDRNTEQLGLDVLEAIAAEIAEQNGSPLALPAADDSGLDHKHRLTIKEAVGLVFEVYPEQMALNDLQIIQVAAFLTAERQADAFEAVHSAVITQRLNEYREKANKGLLDAVNAVRGASDADFLAARGVSQKTQKKSTVLSQLLAMQ